MYRTNFGIGHSIKDLLETHIPPGGRLGRGHKGLYDTINNSLHFQLGLALASLGVITSLVAQHMYSLPAYAFIAQDFTTQAALYTHHQYIAGFIMTGAFAHGAIFFIRDYNPEQNEDNVLARMLDHKEAIISHLSWASLFLGFHTLGLYVHNDVMLAFGTPEKQILLTDIAHHHLAIAFIFLIAGHMYRTNFGIGHSIKDLLETHIPPGGRLGRGHKGLYDTINNSLHFQLGLALASLGVITSLVAQHMYSLPAYAFIAQDFTTQAALYTHHQYIAGFIMTGAFAHGAIFFIRDYNPEQNEDNVLARMLDHKEAIISHLSWASLFLGFHTLGLYVHNDVMLAFGTPEKQILIEPIFAQWIQSAHGKTSYGFDVLLSSTNGPAFNAGRSIWLPGWLNAVNENSNSLFLTIGPGDFLVHHAIALGLHTTTLILVKGALDARGSKLMPDKKDFGYSFPCDGPGRGGSELYH
ncbi:hypothetical protein C4D60_Mb00t10250 [Musa balbisiana]|uniref:Photosystem I n=2 Tax=Musa balbisiana TaxID=52838 RepID=A0A4S8I5H5_MUSBA|nr:hypothetical protein C4D60_Mb00t10250 [Musa balbisiana]